MAGSSVEPGRYENTLLAMANYEYSRLFKYYIRFENPITTRMQ